MPNLGRLLDAVWGRAAPDSEAGQRLSQPHCFAESAYGPYPYHLHNVLPSRLSAQLLTGVAALCGRMRNRDHHNIASNSPRSCGAHMRVESGSVAVDQQRLQMQILSVVAAWFHLVSRHAPDVWFMCARSPSVPVSSMQVARVCASVIVRAVWQHTVRICMHQVLCARL